MTVHGHTYISKLTFYQNYLVLAIKAGWGRIIGVLILTCRSTILPRFCPALQVKANWSFWFIPYSQDLTPPHTATNLKDTIDWNEGAAIKHIWNLFTPAGSLCVAWLHAMLLKGRSF